MRLKSTINESTLSTADAVPLPQWGRQRGGGFAAKKEKPTPPRCARQPLPREGARVDAPSFLWKEVPRRGGGWMGKAVSPTQSLSQWGRLRYEDAAFLDTTLFPMGKAKRRRLCRPKRKPTPPRCARQPLPREGARVDAPSLLWGRLRYEDAAISFLPHFLDLSILFSCRLRS